MNNILTVQEEGSIIHENTLHGFRSFRGRSH